MQFIILATLLASVNALPLNINLGAYSPALVVGDGEISFGGKQDVSNLMNALEGAAVSGAAANGQAAPAAAPAASVAAVPAASASATPSAAPAAANVVPDQGTQITALQGMGKEIAPRIVKLERGQSISEKRDINGFNAALKYAADAIKTTPKIELGTENAGVGILQNAGISASGTGAATPAKAAKRAVKAIDTPRMKTTVTTMFVRGGPSMAQISPKARDVDESAIEKRAPSPGLDGVNLNMAEGQVAELTFVETKEVGVNDDE